MSAIIYKQRFAPPLKLKTPLKNYLHIGYIATRPGAVKNKGLDHGLFGKLCAGELTTFNTWEEVGSHIRKLSERKVTMYRSIISLAEENANDVGLKNLDSWKKYVEENISTIAKFNNIKEENLAWCAAFHNEKGHPHAHIVFWDKEQDIVRSYTHKSIPNKIRIQLIKDTFEERLKDYYKEKDKSKKDIREVTDDMVYEFEEYLKNIYPKELKKLQSQFEGYDFDTTKINIINKFNSEEQEKWITESLFAIRELIPKGGRINYKLLPVETKNLLDSFVSKLVDENTYLKNAVKQYVDSELKIKEMYTSNPENLENYKRKLYTEANKIVANRVLRSIKEIMKKQREINITEFNEMQKKQLTTEFMFELLSFFENTIRENRTKINNRIYGDYSELARKEWYEKNKDKGLGI